ncbi:asparagine synthase (glutamine-hydrolyzing) [Salinispora oceanensis]|uniref:asparagine synthase (glutamine-hydrolyzing) n=1 Tax=Salinispora oceanensis TaxID=1050199 RepID=UPI0003762A51|nr:asparagine synthase (glutamine-hydrolyzing) [Salinispora oceanensis]
MCGIAGWADFGGEISHDPDVAQAMVATLTCRGPDGHGLWLDRQAAIGHTRMSVIDLRGGQQPMTADGQGRTHAVLTYCGEIYNFQELRRELQGRGHRFRTRSDTEVVLHSWLEWDTRAPERLEGMFAFAVWEPARHRLFLARDRLGVKPLYYARCGDAFLFGSEPKAILAHPAVPRLVDADGLREVFSEARTPGSGVFRHIRELRPGHWMEVHPDRVEQRRYWSLTATAHRDDIETTVNTIQQMLGGIVARELVSDVPVAMLLSGGLDSSALTVLAARARQAHGGPRVHSITANYQGYSEHFQPDLVRSAPDAPYARMVAEHVGADHLELTLSSADLMNADSRLACLLAQDVPTPFGDMDTSTYLTFRAVREHAKVALTGESADELFGGYSWIHLTDLAEQPMFPWVSFEQWHPGTRDGLGRGLLDRGLATKLDMDGYYAQAYQRALSEVPVLDGETPEERRMREICHLQLTHWLPMLLDRNDRLSMASGLEVRVPFCDHRFVEYMFNVPWSQKTFDGREKSLLRAAVADLLPDAVLQRPKSPFPVNQDPAYTRALHEAVADTLTDPNSPVAPLIDHAAARAMTEETNGGVQDWLFRMNFEMVLQLNSWLTRYRVDLAL